MRRPVYKANKGMKFIRYAGLDPVKQKNDSAPVRRGLWAFIWPYFDSFFLSGSFSHIHGRFPKEGRHNKSLWKYFWHDGPIFSRFKVWGSQPVGRWYRTSVQELHCHLRKQYATDLATYRKLTGDVTGEKNSNLYKFWGVDAFEVFIPKK